MEGGLAPYTLINSAHAELSTAAIDLIQRLFVDEVYCLLPIIMIEL